MRFAHIADTHIRNLKYHKEYREVFDELYQTLIEEKVDCIIHCGDIAHTKTQISPEFVEMCSNFFSSLADIAPTYIILGNHDGNLKNSGRQDALTPIVNALSHPELHLLKKSGEVLLANNFTLNVLSVFDEEGWHKPSNLDRINIALYHGSISNCKTDLDWVMENGEHNLNIFDDFDYAMLGDIHKCQQLDKGGRVRYCGSTVQQNHGETNNKGFLIWEIEDKESFTVRHIELKNPKPFLTIELTRKGRIPKNTNIQAGARLRLVSNNNLPLDTVRKAAEIAKKRFKPEIVTFLNRAAGVRGSVEELTNSLIKEDLRDPVVQEELIDEYLKDFHADEEVLQRVFELNRKYNAIVEKDEEVARNINWKLISLEWDNLFNYGENNKIDFENLNGVVGVLGKNFSGKSSIIDSFLFILFNSTSKNTRKNLNVINQNENIGRGKVEISANGKIFSIERTAEKYIKKLKGEETLEAKTDVDFRSCDELGNIESGNGLNRIDTDKNIRKIFGTIEDFLLTSMSSQHGALDFINEGSTKRKEILAKFLDLEMFENKFKLVKEEAGDLRGALKRAEGQDFDVELKEALKQLQANENLTKEKKQECHDLDLDETTQREELDAINVKLETAPAEIIDIIQVTNSLASNLEAITLLQKENIQLKSNCEKKRQLYEKIINFIESFNIESYRDKDKQIDDLVGKIEISKSDIKKSKLEQETHQKKINLLLEVPCGEEYSHCKFIKDAYHSKIEIPNLLRGIESQNKALIKLNNNLQGYNVQKISEHIDKYEQILHRRDTVANEIAQCELQIEKNNNQIMILENEVKEFKKKKELYDDNKEVIENYSELLTGKKTIENRVKSTEREVSTCEDELQQLFISHGAYVERVENIKKQQVELFNLRKDYESYDLFLRCVHPNGISYDIIKKRLPLINEEIAKVLANVVDFEVFFEEDDKKLNISIKHFEHDARPLEIGSGAEKSIAAMAIRLALLNVSNLPKPSLFILDEPGTSLDEENMEGFVRILDLVKSYFNTVLLISHLDSLKDCVDTQIVIEEKSGYAHVRQ